MAPRRPRILVVDDDADIRETLAMVLDAHGFDVALAADGQEALLNIARGPRPEVILLDLMMPRMSGWQLREALLKDPSTADIPVVVSSGDANLERSPGLLGTVRRLRKPFDVPTLLGVLQSIGPNPEASA